jgi:hypothetical protein
MKENDTRKKKDAKKQRIKNKNEEIREGGTKGRRGIKWNNGKKRRNNRIKSYPFV